MDTPKSEIFLHIDYTSSSKHAAEMMFSNLTLQLKMTLSPSVMIKDVGNPSLVSYEDQKSYYQVLYILYTDESFEQIRDRISNQWDIDKNKDAIWRRENNQGKAFLGNPCVEFVFLEAFRSGGET